MRSRRWQLNAEDVLVSTRRHMSRVSHGVQKRLELTPCHKQALHDAGKAYVSRVHDLLSEREGLKGRLDVSCLPLWEHS